MILSPTTLLSQVDKGPFPGEMGGGEFSSCLGIDWRVTQALAHLRPMLEVLECLKCVLVTTKFLCWSSSD